MTCSHQHIRLPYFAIHVQYKPFASYFPLFSPLTSLFLNISGFSRFSMTFFSLIPYTESGKIGTVNKQYKHKKKSWDSARIQAFRQHLGLTQRELAERLGTRQQTISEWETGMYQPRGASATLLSIVAEQSRFKYDAEPPKK